MGVRNLDFNRREKLYVADWGTEGTVAVTVQENEQLYTKEEEAVHLLTDGNMQNIPTILPADVERAYKIYGPHPE